MSERISSLHDLAEAVKSLKGPVAVIGHGHPDGDCVGSAIGLVDILNSLKIEAFATTGSPVPAHLQFLYKNTPWKETSADSLSNCTIISIDTARRSLTGYLSDSPLPITLAIDHHISHEPFSDRYYLDAGCTSASQLIAELAREMKIKLSLPAASALYAGMITDTHRFTYCSGGENTARTLEAAAWLSRFGVDTRTLSDELTNVQTREYLNFFCAALQKTEFLENGAVVIAALPHDFFVKCGVPVESKDLFVSQLQAIAGVKMSAVVITSAEGQVKVSVRALREKYELMKFAAQFGGGGHPMACGIRNIKEPLEAFLPRFKAAFVQHYLTYGLSK